MSQGKDQHIVPHPDGWAVLSEGASKPTQVFSTQQEAINKGRDIGIFCQGFLTPEKAWRGWRSLP
jgi:hypothetical protein